MKEYTEETEMALAWFEKNNIRAFIDTDKTSIYIEVNNKDILISGSEVSYRADLHKRNIGALEYSSVTNTDRAVNRLKGLLDWSDRMGSDEIYEISEIIKMLNKIKIN